MNTALTEIQNKKAQLFAQQQELAEQLAALQNEERTIEKEARKEAVAQIEQIILANSIPKYEIVEIYARNNLEGRGRKPSKPLHFEIKNPEPQVHKQAKEIAEQLGRLYSNNQMTEFERVVRANESNLEEILAFTGDEVEEQIIELLD